MRTKPGNSLWSAAAKYGLDGGLDFYDVGTTWKHLNGKIKAVSNIPVMLDFFVVLQVHGTKIAMT